MKSFLLPLLLSACCLSAQVPDSARISLAETERAFAKASAMSGRKNAFVSFFAENCVIYTDKWITSGRDFWEQRKAAPSILKWEPEYVDISAGLDFGFSTGPWEQQDYRPGTKPSGTGYFLSVWKKGPDGEWKVILDAGIPAPPPEVYAHAVRFPSQNGPARPSRNNRDDDPAMAELRFLEQWTKDPDINVYTRYLSQEPIIYRNNKRPMYDMREFKITDVQEITWETYGSGKSPSGDLGYTYGILKKAGSNDTAGHYVRIWKKMGDTWKIVTDMLVTN